MGLFKEQTFGIVDSLHFLSSISFISGIIFIISSHGLSLGFTCSSFPNIFDIFKITDLLSLASLINAFLFADFILGVVLAACLKF